MASSSIVRDLTPLALGAGALFLLSRSDFFKGVGEAGAGIGEGVSGIGSGVSDTFRGAGSGLRTTFESVGSGASNIIDDVSSVTDPFGSFFRGAGNIIEGLFGRAQGVVENFGKSGSLRQDFSYDPIVGVAPNEFGGLSPVTSSGVLVPQSTTADLIFSSDNLGAPGATFSTPKEVPEVVNPTNSKSLRSEPTSFQRAVASGQTQSRAPVLMSIAPSTPAPMSVAPSETSGGLRSKVSAAAGAVKSFFGKLF